jgi:membrane-bound lytic murein transglycosylase B
VAVLTHGFVGRLAAVVLVIAVGGVGVWAMTRATAEKPSLAAEDIPALQVSAADVQPGSVVPANLTAAGPVAASAPAPATRPQPVARRPSSLIEWANLVAAGTGIPEPAVLAYGNAELAVRASQASCRLSWATLAGIGRVESDHGQFGGAVLLPNGEESKPVIGVPLNGSAGVQNLPASDGGALAGDPVYAHAVGPMQFLPSTWYVWAADALGNGHPDPENINDAALAAGRYLCADGRDLSTPTGWWSAVLSYNNSVQYAQKVFGVADGYAQAALQALSASSQG